MIIDVGIKYYKKDFDGSDDFLGFQKCLSRICLDKNMCLDGGIDEYGEYLVISQVDSTDISEKSFLIQRIEKMNSLELALNQYQESDIQYNSKNYEVDDSSVVRMLVLNAMFKLKGQPGFVVYTPEEIKSVLKLYCERFLFSDAKFSDLKNQSRKIDNVNDLNKLSIDEVTL